MVYGLTYKSLIHFEFIFCMVLISLFTCSCPVFPESHMEQPVFYPLNCHRLVDLRYMGLYLDFPSHSTDLYFSFSLSTILFSLL